MPRGETVGFVMLSLITVANLSRTDKSLQTVQTQNKLLLEESLIRVYAVCNLDCICFKLNSIVKPLCLNFSDYSKYLGCQNLGKLQLY